MKKPAIKNLLMIIVLFGWVYIVTGVIFGIVRDTGHWFSISARIAGIAAISIHLIELPVSLSRSSDIEKSRLKVVTETLIFGSVSWIQQ